MPPFVILVTTATYMTSASILNYTDDMVLLAPTTDVLQDLINVCQVYAAKHDIVFNTTKTEFMVIPQTHSKVNRFIYFCHVLHRDMTDDDIKKQTTKFTVTRKFSDCSLKMKLKLLRSH